MRAAALLLLSAAAVADFDPRTLGLDLACSACTLTANVIEQQLAALGVEAEETSSGGRDGSISARMAVRMERHCASLTNIAQSGPEGEREYVDLGMALQQDKKGRPETKLHAVQMGPTVVEGVRAACRYFSTELLRARPRGHEPSGKAAKGDERRGVEGGATTQLETALKRARTLADLALRRTMCSGKARKGSKKSRGPLARREGVCRAAKRAARGRKKEQEARSAGGSVSGAGRQVGEGQKTKQKKQKADKRVTAQNMVTKEKKKGRGKEKKKKRKKSAREGASDSARAAYLAGRPFLIGRGRVGEGADDGGEDEEAGEEERARLALGLEFAAHMRCEACALVVEEVSGALQEEVRNGQRALQAGERKNAEFDVRQTVTSVCDRYAKAAEEDARRRKAAKKKQQQQQQHEDTVGMAGLPPLPLSAPLSRVCAEVLRTPRLVDAFARAFSGDPPVPSNVYQRRGVVCSALSASCAPPPAALAPRVSSCEACRLVVRDAVGQLRRRSATGAKAVRVARRGAIGGGGSGGKKVPAAVAARKAEVWTVLEGLCAGAEARHPRTIAVGVTEQCEELLEDSEGAIGEALVRRLLTPAAAEIGSGSGEGRLAAAREASSALTAALALEHEICIVATQRCDAGDAGHDEL